MLRRPGDQSADSALAVADGVLLGKEGDADPQAAYALYAAAADTGSGAAAERMAVMAAMGVAQGADFGKALDLLARAGNLGHRPAQKQLTLLSGRKDLMTRTPKGAVWAKVRAEIDIAAMLAPPAMRQALVNPAAFVIEGLVSKAVCRWIIERGKGRLEASSVNDATTGEARPDVMRTARAAHFRVTDTDVVIAVLQERLARLAKLPVYTHEPPNLLHYSPGQEYRAHFDFIHPGVAGFRDELALLGQRIATCLVYLNDDYDGGETRFVKAGWSYRGKPGDALLFYNVTSNKQPDPSSLHAGLPPTRGEKWVLSLWVRDKVQPIL